VLEMMKGSLQLSFLKEPTTKDTERERFAMYHRKLLNEILLEQLVGLGRGRIVGAGVGERLLAGCLELMGNRLYCTRCSFCENCENSGEPWSRMNRQLQEIVLMLFGKE
jgi:hypothetical protein